VWFFSVNVDVILGGYLGYGKSALEFERDGALHNCVTATGSDWGRNVGDKTVAVKALNGGWARRSIPQLKADGDSSLGEIGGHKGRVRSDSGIPDNRNSAAPRLADTSGHRLGAVGDGGRLDHRHFAKGYVAVADLSDFSSGSSSGSSGKELRVFDVEFSHVNRGLRGERSDSLGAGEVKRDGGSLVNADGEGNVRDVTVKS